MGDVPWLDASGAAMWALVERHTGRVGYKRGIKANGLDNDPPVIDCWGWVAVLLSSGMAAANNMTARALFREADIAAVHVWSDDLIESLEKRSGIILTGDRITVAGLPRYATIGLQQGGGAWAANHPRPRGITHVVQIVRRPWDGVPFVSEAQEMTQPYGLRLMPLQEWLERARDYLKPGMAWG
jgi:hypothetical protein